MQRNHTLQTDHYYHIYNRGVDKRKIFDSENDFKRFILLLRVANSKESIRLDNLINILGKSYSDILLLDIVTPLVSIGAWCLMPNHFHIVLRQERENGITDYMRRLCTAYSMYFNKKYDRSGGLFGSKFKSKLIEDDAYMMYLFQYIHLNPLDTMIDFTNWKEGLLAKKSLPSEAQKYLETYDYSSFQDYEGVVRAENGILMREGFHEYYSTEAGADDLKTLYKYTNQ